MREAPDRPTLHAMGGRRISAVALATCVVLSLAAAGCTSARSDGEADKAGGSTGRVVLRLGAAYSGDLPGATDARYFAAQVARLSKGTMRVDVVFSAGGDAVPDVEPRLARSVRDGDYDLGWIGSRAWDELGVTSFEALQTPFLVTNYALLDRIARSPLADEMLAGLERYGVVGLALVPSLLRHPVGFSRPFTSVSDFAGAHIRTNPSRTTDAIVRALGATPVHVANADIGAGIVHHVFEGQESDLAVLPVSDIAVSANVVLFGKALTLFANERSLDRLDDGQRAVVREAARLTVELTADHKVAKALGYENVLLRQWCASRPRGRAVLASPAELAGLVRATRPAVVQLERDRQIRSMIAAIRRMKASLPPAPPITAPAECLRPKGGTAVSRATSRSPSSLNGTYRWVLTKKGAEAFGPPANDPGGGPFPIVNEIVLRDGSWWTPRSAPPDSGTYSVMGNRLILAWPSFGYSGTFRFTRDADGTLHLTALPPMDRGDRWVWSGAPWRRIGPPRDVTH